MTGRHVVAFFCLWVLSAGLGMDQATAETQEMQGFKDWVVYKKEASNGRICFMSSVPKKLRGEYERSNRGETRVFVSHGPGEAERNVLSVLAGYRYKKQTEVDFVIDGNKSTLFTLENRAWAQSPKEDLNLITQMKRGAKLVITGISSRGNTTIDEYSLSGFTAAKAFLDKACP